MFPFHTVSISNPENFVFYLMKIIINFSMTSSIRMSILTPTFLKVGNKRCHVILILEIFLPVYISQYPTFLISLTHL